jgi:hypothetical protein
VPSWSQAVANVEKCRAFGFWALKGPDLGAELLGFSGIMIELDNTGEMEEREAKFELRVPKLENSKRPIRYTYGKTRLEAN